MENRTVGMGFTDLYFCCVFLSLLKSLDEQEARCRDGMGKARVLLSPLSGFDKVANI